MSSDLPVWSADYAIRLTATVVQQVLGYAPRNHNDYLEARNVLAQRNADTSRRNALSTLLRTESDSVGVQRVSLALVLEQEV